MKHFCQDWEGNGGHEERDLHVCAGRGLVAVVVVAEGEDVEAFPVGAAHAPLHALAEGLGVKGRTASYCDVWTAYWKQKQNIFIFPSAQLIN